MKRGEKCEKKGGGNRVKNGENHSDPIYTNPIKNLPSDTCSATGIPAHVCNYVVRGGQSTPKKSTQNTKSSSEQVSLSNFRWVPDSRHREDGKSSCELFEKVRANAPLFFFLVFRDFGWVIRSGPNRIAKSGRFANFVREPGFNLNSPAFSREKPLNSGENGVYKPLLRP